MMGKLMIDSVAHVGDASTRSTASASTSWATSPRRYMVRLRRALDRADAAPRRRRRQAHLPLRRGLELRRGRRRRPLRAGDAAQHGRHGHRDVQRPPARRRARRRPVRRRPARPGLRNGPVHRPQRRRPSTARADEQRARLAALPGPDQGRPGRQPARLRVHGRDRRDGQGLRGGLQRPAGRATRPTRAETDHLRRRPRQRDALRRRCSTSSRRRPRWPTACA